MRPASSRKRSAELCSPRGVKKVKTREETSSAAAATSSASLNLSTLDGTCTVSIPPSRTSAFVECTEALFSELEVEQVLEEFMVLGGGGLLTATQVTRWLDVAVVKDKSVVRPLLLELFTFIDRASEEVVDAGLFVAALVCAVPRKRMCLDVRMEVLFRLLNVSDLEEEVEGEEEGEEEDVFLSAEDLFLVLRAFLDGFFVFSGVARDPKCVVASSGSVRPTDVIAVAAHEAAAACCGFYNNSLVSPAMFLAWFAEHGDEHHATMLWQMVAL